MSGWAGDKDLEGRWPPDRIAKFASAIFAGALLMMAGCKPASPVARHGCNRCHSAGSESIGPSYERIAQAYCTDGPGSLVDFLQKGAAPRLSKTLAAMQSIRRQLSLEGADWIVLARDVMEKGGCTAPPDTSVHEPDASIR